MMFDHGDTENSVMDNGGGLIGSWVAVGGGYYWLLLVVSRRYKFLGPSTQ